VSSVWVTHLLVGSTPGGCMRDGPSSIVFDGGGVAPVVVAVRGCPPVRSQHSVGRGMGGVELLRGDPRRWVGGGEGGARVDGVAVTGDAVGSANPSSLVGGWRWRRRRCCHGKCWARRRSVRRFSFRASARGRGCSSRSASLSCVWRRGDDGASGNAGLLCGQRGCGGKGLTCMLVAVEVPLGRTLLDAVCVIPV